MVSAQKWIALCFFIWLAVWAGWLAYPMVGAIGVVGVVAVIGYAALVSVRGLREEQ